MRNKNTRNIQFEQIGVIHSCYKEKFGIPRQPNLVTEAKASLVLTPPFHHEDIVRELEHFSHIWVIFVFHQSTSQWKPTVRPPRLGGNKRVGVFASRSPFRPNPIGMSLLELSEIRHGKGKIILELLGADLLDGTPVLDIKPYIPYADSIENARSAYAPSEPNIISTVSFSDKALQQCLQKEQNSGLKLQTLIIQILEQDPRPSYKIGHLDQRLYSMKLYDFDLRWRYHEQDIEVLELDPIKEPVIKSDRIS